ncbi:MAG: hypothetical protein DA328_05960 [Nitrososphaeraceae archaeon]|jgi:hypothetical protein|nr:hypothetical protein [Nitrososphaeraceae archaeon]
MTYRDIVSQVKAPFHQGVAPQSQRLSSRHIISIALRKRSKLLAQEREKKSLKDKFLLQSICIPLIEVAKHECSCVSINGCKVLRSKNKIPTPLKESEKQVVSIDGSISFSPTTFKDYKEFQRLKVNSPKFYIMNEYLYISGVEDLQWVKLIDVFEDPYAADNYTDCSEETPDSFCSSALETEFRILPKLEDAVILLIIEELYKSWQNGLQDIINNQTIDGTGK